MRKMTKEKPIVRTMIYRQNDLYEGIYDELIKLSVDIQRVLIPAGTEELTSSQKELITQAFDQAGMLGEDYFKYREKLRSEKRFAELFSDGRIFIDDTLYKMIYFREEKLFADLPRNPILYAENMREMVGSYYTVDQCEEIFAEVGNQAKALGLEEVLVLLTTINTDPSNPKFPADFHISPHAEGMRMKCRIAEHDMIARFSDGKEFHCSEIDYSENEWNEVPHDDRSMKEVFLFIQRNIESAGIPARLAILPYSSKFKLPDDKWDYNNQKKMKSSRYLLCLDDVEDITFGEDAVEMLKPGKKPNTKKVAFLYDHHIEHHFWDTHAYGRLFVYSGGVSMMREKDPEYGHSEFLSVSSIPGERLIKDIAMKIKDRYFHEKKE